MKRATPAQEIRLQLAAPGETSMIDAAIALGNADRATLGYLPFAAYTEAAAHEELLLAVADGRTLVGYALFDLTNRHIRLVHLCVREGNRGIGLARQLVDWISARHRDRAGIQVWCRRDYRLGAMWSNLGFQRLEERHGRGRGRGVLVAWWKDHGHPTLFSQQRPGVVVRASVDLNVLRDLADDARLDRDESLALLSDQLADRLELVRTGALDLEIEGIDEPLRQRCARLATTLFEVSLDAAFARRCENELRVVAQRTDPSFANSDQGKQDIRYVAEAIAAGLNVFITRDEHLTALLSDSALANDLRILRPAEVVVRIDELARAEAYRPGPVGATLFTKRLIAAGAEASLDRFVGRSTGERIPALRRRVRSLTVQGVERVGIYDAVGELVGIFMLRPDGHVLEVFLLRVLPGTFAATILRQILFLLRLEAISRAATAIRLSDAHLTRDAIAAALEDGFMPDAGTHVCLVLDICAAASIVSAAAVTAARAASIDPPPTLESRMTPFAAAEVERSWWPVKVIDSLLPSYLIPIRQTYSHELLGAPLGVFARPATLGLSREHVYYRSPRGARLHAPSRLLWYMSGSSPGSIEPASVVAASLLEEVVQDSPERLHARFRHLGVWRVEQIASAAFKGQAQGLRFSHTATFPKQVPLATVRRIVGRPPQGPIAISSDAFAAIYAEGHGDA